MAFEVKYRINFNTLEGDACIVDMLFDNYVGSVIILEPSARPFVLREFNNDEDLYKPLRPQQAEINFISQTGISINDFIGNSDEYCRVEFFHGGARYWSGYILQDDVQEEWSDQKHIINLRASENLGSLKSIPLANTDGSELIGRFTALQLLQIANSDAVQVVAAKNQFLRVISNLYNDVMNTASPGINQTYIDARTFSVGDGEYEDKYTVIEKINRAFSQTLLQYMNSWYYYRPEELYMPVANNLRQFNYNPLVLPPSDWTSSSVRFDINIGKTQTVKPIAPQMLRFIKRPTKVDQINFTYDYPSEIFPNQNFQRGTLITSTSTYKTYTINNWTAYKGSKTSPTLSTKQHYRKDLIDGYGNKIDSYIYLEREDLGAENWFQSEDILVSRNDVLDISFLWKWSESQAVISPIPTHYVAQVFLTSSAAIPATFYLNEKGEWIRGTRDSSINKYLKLKPDDASIQENKYMEKAVLTNPIPIDGVITLLFTNRLASTSPLWSQLQVRLQGSINGLTTQNIAGEFSRFTKTEDIRSNFSDEIYLADLTNNNFLGCLFDETDFRLFPTWYRFRYNTESMSFMKQNLIAQWENSRFFRTKIDGTFYGLKQGSLKIGLINTIKFVDDDPNKLYAIVNMKEIDFANATWSATLLEVYDSTRDTGNETTYPTYLRDFIYK
jgi:hypothetical protein